VSELSNSREAILNRIRAANSAANALTPISDYRAIERTYQQTSDMDHETVLRTFADRLREYDAQFIEIQSDALAITLADIFKSRGQKSAIVVDDFSEESLPECISWSRESACTTEEMNMAEGAISGCEVAIAHTGTIILRGARRLTLLPDRLLCVVHECQVVETVPEAFAAMEKYKTAALTFVSGPSATADIEMTRIRGVHGPRFMDVVLVRS